MSWIIVQFHSLYSHVFNPDGGWAWGLSIASMVVVIRICLIPLFVKQIKSTRAMQAIQPKMKAIQERYKNDRQRQSEEMMKLYKEAGTNPFSSCLPILVQMPFFTALYGVLSSVAKGHPIGVINGALLASAGKAHIFGAPLSASFVHSTSTNVKIVTAVMIVMMSASQFITQRQLMTKNIDLSVKTPFMQQQKMLMYVFPVMFAVMGINFPVGVLVYWLTTNIWSMGQQLIVIRNNPTPGSQAWDERQARLKAARPAQPGRHGHQGQRPVRLPRRGQGGCAAAGRGSAHRVGAGAPPAAAPADQGAAPAGAHRCGEGRGGQGGRPRGRRTGAGRGAERAGRGQGAGLEWVQAPGHQAGWRECQAWAAAGRRSAAQEEALSRRPTL